MGNDEVHTNYASADKRRSCTRKVAYPSQQVANLGARAVNARAGYDAVRAYACTDCGCWHLGGKPQDDVTGHVATPYVRPPYQRRYPGMKRAPRHAPWR